MNCIEAKELYPKELDRVKFPRRTGESIDINKITWYDLADFDSAKEIYLTELSSAS